ncbi:hypothetical protein [Telluria aromaticivorans]|uniref:Uncharacterized protein n=1 Tax=Telluria aromaticivorans TaxID=2725995 RepID=A0A7Y2NXU4_9BURK|nr:hypothetical protein [Telluria aromaticivorans]NNG22092.1 hypothetical protein [Telluria aromaticivorans]
MKKIVLALAVAAFATAAMAAPAKPKCSGVCPPIVEQVEQAEPALPEEVEPMWAEEVEADPFLVVGD